MVMFRHEHAVWTMWTCSAKMVFSVFDDFMYKSYMDSFENCLPKKFISNCVAAHFPRPCGSLLRTCTARQCGNPKLQTEKRKKEMKCKDVLNEKW